MNSFSKIAKKGHRWDLKSVCECCIEIICGQRIMVSLSVGYMPLEFEEKNVGLRVIFIQTYIKGSSEEMNFENGTNKNGSED